MSVPVLTEPPSAFALRRVTARPGRHADAASECADGGRLATFRDLDDPCRHVRLRGVPDADQGVFTLTLAPLRPAADGTATRAFGRCVHPWLVGLGGELAACWIGEPPVVDEAGRAGVEAPAIAWLTRFRDAAAQRRHAALMAECGCLDNADWRAHLAGAAAQWRLAPAAHPLSSED